SVSLDSGGIIGRLIRDHIDHFFVAGARQIRYWAVQSFLLDLGNLLERQVRLSSIRRCRLLVTFDELARQPAKYIISNASRMTNVGVFCEPARLKSLIGEFFHQTLQRHAVLQRDRSKCADGIHSPTDRASLLRHRDEELTGLSVLVQTDCDVTFMPGDLEPVGERGARVRHTMPD